MNGDPCLTTSIKPKFLADAMLGRLAKWLRLLGYDTRYVSDITDTEALELAESEGRIILTRDTLLIRRKCCREYIFIASDHWREQLKQVYQEAKLSDDFMLSRCSTCNVPLHSVDKESVELFVPPYVFSTQDRFSRCDGCLRIFWRATHVCQIFNELKTLREEP